MKTGEMMYFWVLILGLLHCAAEDRRTPVIKRNQHVLELTEIVLTPRTPLFMSCEGANRTGWVNQKITHKKHISGKYFRLRQVSVEHTGTYQCVNLEHMDLFSSVHIYVKDPDYLFAPIANPVQVTKFEGDDYLIECLLTDPSATDFMIYMENGTSAPFGMNYTADPHRGVFIRNLQPSYSAHYVCSAKVNGVEKTSQAFSIDVLPRLYAPPAVSLEVRDYVRIVGESLKIICNTHNPNYQYYVTWKYSSQNRWHEDQKLNHQNGLSIKSTLTAPAVNLSDTGNYTCVAGNQVGINSSTASLQVVEEGYIWLTPQLPPDVAGNSSIIKVHQGEDVKLRVLIEAYPQILHHHWVTPLSYNSSAVEQTFEQNKERYTAVLLLKRITAEEQGLYIFYANNSHDKNSTMFEVRTYQTPTALLTWENSTTLTCTSFGHPRPSIAWYQCSGIQVTCREDDAKQLVQLSAQTVKVEQRKYGTVEVQSMVTLTKPEQDLTIECVALNFVGMSHDAFAIQSSFWTLKIITIVAGVIGAVCLLMLLAVLYKYKQKPRYEIRWKIIESYDGSGYSFIDPTQLPYNKKLEFPRDKLTLGKVLGAGAFGKVVEATAYGLGTEENVTRVAVKMLKPSARSDEKEALMSELKILSHLGQHKNIVNLLGACTHGGPYLIITEYCSHGDLQTFLRNKSESFLNFVMSTHDVPVGNGDYKNLLTKRISVASDSGVSFCSDDCQLPVMRHVTPGTSQRSSSEEAQVDTSPLSLHDLLRFSYNVAQGLEFLASKNCIHRDIAARNVLLSDGLVAKICDFGLARDIMNDSNYVVKGNARLPVKWMAPESIFDCVYTMQSDVWSYGILLWEIYSLGKNPYPNIPVDARFYKMIRDGYHMPQPDFATQDIYTIIKMCWNLEPMSRPNFHNISNLFESLLQDQPLKSIYKNIQCDQISQSCETQRDCEESQAPAGNHEEEEKLLVKTNLYQFR